MVIDEKTYAEIRIMAAQGMSERKIARKTGVSKSTVHKYKTGKHLPGKAGRKKYTRASRVMTPAVKAKISEYLEEDRRENLKKQKHTAVKIHERLTEEEEIKISYSTVRLEVNRQKDICIPPIAVLPLAFDPGEAVQVDFGEAHIYLADIRTKTSHFCGRLCYSCAPFVRTGFGQNTESFLESLQKMFEFFGGVPRRVIFDNGSAAVKSGYGKKALATDQYRLMAAHYGFETVFCNPASGNEKGLVENLVGYSRREYMVPVPRKKTVDEINEELVDRCLKYIEEHVIETHSMSVKEQYSIEKKELNALPEKPFETARVRTDVAVRPDGLVRFEKNWYSVPSKYSGRKLGVSVKGYGTTVEIWVDQNREAVHTRLYGTGKASFRLEHYIDQIAVKPRAAFQAEPVVVLIRKEIRDILRRLTGGDRDMVEVLKMAVRYGIPAVEAAVERISDEEIITVEKISSAMGVIYERDKPLLAEPGKFEEIPITKTDVSKYDELIRRREI